MLLVKTGLRPSSIHGLGVFAAEFIPAGTVVWRFQPDFDFRVPEESVVALPEIARTKLLHYSAKWGGGYVISADDSRFINHSSGAANLRTLDEPDVDISMRDIQAGEELLEDYREFDDTFEGRPIERGIDATWKDGPGERDSVGSVRQLLGSLAGYFALRASGRDKEFLRQINDWFTQFPCNVSDPAATKDLIDGGYYKLEPKGQTCPTCGRQSQRALNLALTADGELQFSTCLVAADPREGQACECAARKAQIKAMVDRFLTWRLPDNFNPDGGVSFNPHRDAQVWPVGTNLLDADQAEAMIRHIAVADNPCPCEGLRAERDLYFRQLNSACVALGGSGWLPLGGVVEELALMAVAERDSLRAELAASRERERVLRDKLARVYRIASGEDQVAQDDTDGMAVIAAEAAALLVTLATPEVKRG